MAPPQGSSMNKAEQKMERTKSSYGNRICKVRVGVGGEERDTGVNTVKCWDKSFSLECLNKTLAKPHLAVSAVCCPSHTASKARQCFSPLARSSANSVHKFCPPHTFLLPPPKLIPPFQY